MTMNQEDLKTLVLLAETAEALYGVAPGGCTDEDGNVSGHWSGTKAEMEAVLGRRLTPAEVTVLSLTRCFGPLPLIEGEWDNPTWKPLFHALWPEGNGSGLYMEWGDFPALISNAAESVGWI